MPLGALARRQKKNSEVQPLLYEARLDLGRGRAQSRLGLPKHAMLVLPEMVLARLSNIFHARWLAKTGFSEGDGGWLRESGVLSFVMSGAGYG